MGGFKLGLGYSIEARGGFKLGLEYSIARLGVDLG